MIRYRLRGRPMTKEQMAALSDEEHRQVEAYDTAQPEIGWVRLRFGDTGDWYTNGPAKAAH